MSFLPITKAKKRVHKDKGVCVALNRDQGGFRFVMIIFPAVLKKLDWHIGDQAMVMRGAGDHQGLICLKKGQGFALGRIGKNYPVARLSLKAWSGLAHRPIRSKPVNFNTDNDLLTVDISSLYEVALEHPKATRD